MGDGPSLAGAGRALSARCGWLWSRGGGRRPLVRRYLWRRQRSYDYRGDAALTVRPEAPTPGRDPRKPFYIRFCFPDAATADAFRNRFGGECLTHAPGKPKPRTPATSSDPQAVTREEENFGKG